MRVLDVGGDVFLLRFLPDNRRLVVGTANEKRTGTFHILALPDGERVPLKMSRVDPGSLCYDDYYGNPVAVHPGSEVCYIAWVGRLQAFRTDNGKSLPVPRGVQAHQVVLSPDGDRLLAAHRTPSIRKLFAVTLGPKGGTVVWRKAFPAEFARVAGFLPDGEQFVTVDGAVRIRDFKTGEELSASRVKSVGTQQPQISHDGRHLGLVGYSSMYFWDLTTLDRPRKIGGSSNFGDFRSFAFHPGGKTVAVIHGGPTLVKLYDLSTLSRVRDLKWRLGPLQSVAFSPDGSLGAAGTKDGRVVVWDVEE